MLTNNPPLSKAACTYHVGAYLHGQGWELADNQELAADIWQTLQGRELSGAEALKQVETEVWQRYALILHDHCRRPDSAGYNRAWSELGTWLKQQVGRLTDHPQDQEEVVQDTLVELQNRLAAEPLRAPRAFLAYALAGLRRKNIDLHRRRTTAKRGKGDILSLEGMSSGDSGGEERTWQETVKTSGQERRATEYAVADKQLRAQILAFFHAHLSSDLQRRVAEAHFLDGLSPAEIAALMGKTPHEIRMAKSRAVRRLRSLPAAKQEELLAILDRVETAEAEE